MSYAHFVQPHLANHGAKPIAERRAKLAHLFRMEERNPSPPEVRIKESGIVSSRLMFESTSSKMTYHREKIQIKSRRGDWILAYLLIPDAKPHASQPKKLPCVICAPGHGTGLDLLVGLDVNDIYAGNWDGTPQDYALFFVRKGYAVCAFEQFGIGHGKPALLKGVKNCKRACGLSDYLMRLHGRSTMAERVADARAVLDYVQTRNEIDPARIAMMGVSAGATTTLLTSALDERIKCAIVISYLTRFKNSIYKDAHCMCNYTPGLVYVADVPEIAELVAPRNLFIEHSMKDAIFPYEVAQQAYQSIRNTFDESAIKFVHSNHKHASFSGHEAIAFLQNHL